MSWTVGEKTSLRMENDRLKAKLKKCKEGLEFAVQVLGKYSDPNDYDNYDATIRRAREQAKTLLKDLEGE
jgi:hypothetical protein